MENEVWAQVCGFDGFYVSNMGRVKSSTGRVHKLNRLKSGYLRATFRTKDGIFSKRVNRLVAIHFIENPNSYPFVNHLDGNKENNAHWNLEWCDHEMNMAHASATGLVARGSRVNTSKLTNPDVLLIRKLYESGGYSQRSLASRFGVAKNAIKMIVNRKSWKHI